MDKSSLRQAIIAGCIVSIVLGIFLSNEYQNNYIYPLDRARVLLLDVQATSNSQSIETEIKEVKMLLPKSGNPVWALPTSDTDFGLMQKNLDFMMVSVDNISCYNNDGTECGRGLYNVHTQATSLVFNLLDATPYMYVSIEFILINALWITGTFGLTILAKKR